MTENTSMTRVPVERLECFHVSATWRKEQKVYFYLDLARDGSKAEKSARKELAKLLTQEKANNGTHSRRVYHEDCEGVGYHWRVERSILLKYAGWLSLPCSIEEELIRYEREKFAPPESPIIIRRISHDLEAPHIIGLQLDSSNERLRRALDQYIELHWMKKEDWQAMNSYGAHITITRGMLKTFIDWFEFARPLEDMLQEAMADAKEAAERHKLWEEQRQWREQHYQEEAHRTYSQYQHYYSNYRSLFVPNRSELEEALELFSLDRATATSDTIKKRYRQLALITHPDTGGDEIDFKRVNSANEVLKRYFT